MEVLIELIREWGKGENDVFDLIIDQLIELGYPKTAQFHKGCKATPQYCFLYMALLQYWYRRGGLEAVKNYLDRKEDL